MAARLYLCTDARRERGDLAQFADAALAGGVDIIQLRDKGSVGEQRFGPLEARDELEACAILADAARRHGALFAVNDRADIARASGADVLHLGQGDLPPAVARDIVGPDTVVGLSTHDADQVAAAADSSTPGQADYFCVGPCWPTPTKPGRTAPGLGLIRAAAQSHSALDRQAVVRDRGHRCAAAARGARGRCPAHRGRARDHRGRRPPGRSAAAQVSASSSELMRGLNCEGT